MAVAVLFEFPNSSLDQYDRVLELEPRTKDQPARTQHVAYELPGGGFAVLDVWESDEAFGRFGEILMPAIQQAGLESAGPPKVFPVHNTL